VLGVPPNRPEALFRLVGYCTQYDSFPAGATGLSFLSHPALYGLRRPRGRGPGVEILERVGLAEAGGRRIAGYSKGMRQRVKLAHASATTRRC
jgi:ABC-2 type transport system ATP-binding protein